MSTKLEVAAALLARELTNPLGAVNTMAVRQGKKGIIRVLIDPTQERFVRSVPQRFRGYAVIVEQGETSYGAYVPDLPGCVAVAETKEGVISLIKEAIEFHLEDIKQEGQPIPLPSSFTEYIEVAA